MYTVIVIDDSASMRRVLSDLINQIEDFQVVETAVDAYEAREKIKLYEPDLVTIDLNMPKMDGAVFLRNLMKLHPMPAVVVSGESARGNDIFDDGAVGFIEKQKIGEGIQDFGKRIEDSLLNLTFLLKRYSLKKPKPQIQIETPNRPKNNQLDFSIENKNYPDVLLSKNPAITLNDKIIAIGSSTGGVESLLKVFEKLPNTLPPIVMAQHIPYGFSSSFAQRLNNNSEIYVREATDGCLLERGCAYLAPGNMHLSIEKRGSKFYTKLLDGPKITRHKPSVDILFRSVNNTYGGSAMAVMMTGMGDDGSICMKELFDNNAYTLAQDEASCVVFGMPKKAIEIGAVKEICSLENIPNYIIDFANGKKR